MSKLTKLQNETFSQMIQDDNMSASFSTSLQKSITKVGVVTVLSVCAFASNMAHADSNLNVMLGVSAVTGVLSHGSQALDIPGCNVQGYSGYKIGGSAAAAAYAGNQIGKGSGKKIATIGAGLLAGAGAMALENSRVEREKQECLQRLQIQAAQVAAANYAHNYNNGANYAPGSAANNATGPSVLYSFQSNQYQSQMLVSTENSPGVQALRGYNPNAQRDPRQDPNIYNSIQRSINGLQIAYERFQVSSEQYINIVNSNKMARNGGNKQQLKQAVKNWDQAFDVYAKERAFTAATFDNVVLNGYNVSQFSNILNLYQPPANATIACECVLPNRFSTVPKDLTAKR